MMQHETWLFFASGALVLLALLSAMLYRRFRIAQQKREATQSRLQEQAERQVQNEQMLWRLPFFLVLHTEAEICYCNEAALRFFGKSDASQVIGKPLSSFAVASDKASLDEFIKAALEQKSDAPLSIKIFRFQTPEGDARLQMLSAARIEHRAKPAVVLAADIVTRVARPNEQNDMLYDFWRPHHKVEAACALARGIAHEFATIFNDLATLAHQAKTRLTSIDALHQDLAAIETKIQSGLAAAQRISTLVKSDATSLSKLSLWSVVETAHCLLNATLSSYFSLKLTRDAKSDLIYGDENLLQQLMLNLITAVKGALPACNKVAIEVCEPTAFPMPSFFGSQCLSRYVALIIGDAASESNAPITMLDPASFAKEHGQSFGISLLIAHNIVKMHNGLIGTQCEAQRHLRFVMLFPLAEPAIALLEAKPVLVSAPQPFRCNAPKRGKTIMIVDDEKHLCEIMSRALRSAGYAPLAFTSSHDALETFIAKRDEIDLCIFDLTLPEINGEELFIYVHKQMPHLPIIIASGSIEPAHQHRLKRSGVSTFLIKPFKLKTLLEAVESTLQD